ncbi:MAG: hypothetical protein ACRDT8_00515 [Micromonosporaceae bacterium]
MTQSDAANVRADIAPSGAAPPAPHPQWLPPSYEITDFEPGHAEHDVDVDILPPEPLAWDDPAAWEADPDDAPEPDPRPAPKQPKQKFTARPKAALGRPGRIVVAALLSGALAVPMVAGAGSLAARAVAGAEAASALLAAFAIAMMATAAVNVLGAFRLAERGSPRTARVGGYLSLALTAASLAVVLTSAPSLVAAALTPVLLAPAITMLALLASRPARRWLAARDRRAARHRD